MAMGHTSSKMAKFKRSFRRMSLSKSRDNLKTEDLKKIRHSRSLTNLTFRKKDVVKLSDEKKLRRNTVVISTHIPVNGDTEKGKIIEDKKEDEIETLVSTDLNDNNEQIYQNIEKGKETVLNKPIVKDCSGVLALKVMDSRLKEMENQIVEMSQEDLFVYHSTFKDEIHNFWIKAYGVKEANEMVKPKKNETIDYVKKLLFMLNNKMFQRNAGVDSYC